MLKRLLLGAAITCVMVVVFASNPVPAQSPGVLVGGGDCDSAEARCERRADQYEARTSCGGQGEPTCAEVRQTVRKMYEDCAASSRRCRNDRHGEQRDTDPAAQDDSPRRTTCF